MNDLAERLNSVGATCDCADVDSLDWRDHFELCPLRLLDEAIAALTPVLPDDVKSLVSSLNNSPSDLYGVVVCAKFREAADMLERLAREQEYYETGCRVECDRNKELQQRIAELEAEIIELRDECSNAEAIQPPPGQSDE